MSFLLSCPFCGPRPVDEYAYFGEVTTRPSGSPTLRELTDYVYFRDNVAGVQREWWQHRTGCGEWFLAERDTRTNEVLDVMVELARSGMTMIVVTHEMGFARKVANRVVFLSEGQIVEEAPPEKFFTNPTSDRAKDFLSKILTH